MPKLEKPPPFDLEKALEEDNEYEDSFEAFMRLPLPQKKKKSQNKKKPKPKKKKHNFDMFEERPKKGKTPRKKTKLKRIRAIPLNNTPPLNRSGTFKGGYS